MCVLSGCRAPQLAAGELDGLLNLLFDQAYAEILLLPSVMALSPEDKVMLLADIGLARQHIVLFFKMKLNHWRQLPHVLHGIAHHDSLVARRCAQRALALYDHQKQPSDQHALTVKLCRPGSRGRRQMEAFIAGVLLRELPCLEAYAARFMLVVVIERWIESRHAITKRLLARSPNGSCVQIAWGILKLVLQKRMLEHEFSTGLLNL